MYLFSAENELSLIRIQPHVQLYKLGDVDKKATIWSFEVQRKNLPAFQDDMKMLMRVTDHRGREIEWEEWKPYPACNEPVGGAPLLRGKLLQVPNSGERKYEYRLNLVGLEPKIPQWLTPEELETMAREQLPPEMLTDKILEGLKRRKACSPTEDHFYTFTLLQDRKYGSSKTLAKIHFL